MFKSTIVSLSVIASLLNTEVVFAKAPPPPEPNPAIFITEGDSSFGKNTVTVDSQTNLEWLDLSLTNDLSYNDVVSQLNTTYAGFHIATFNELNQFFLDAGVYSGAVSFKSFSQFISANLNDNSKGLINMWAGFNAVSLDMYGYGLFQSGAIINQSSINNMHDTFNFTYITALPASGSESGSIFSGSQADNLHSNFLGVALVRAVPTITSPVPEPKTYVTFLLGIGILASFNRKKVAK